MQKQFFRFAVILLLMIGQLPLSAVPSTQSVNREGYTEVQCELKPFSRPIRREGESPEHRTPPRTDGANNFTHPRMTARNGTSQNWSGYAALTNLTHPAHHAVDAVAGTWTVPTIIASNTTTYCAIWIGIDGYASESVEQLGTEHEWVNGRQVNFAWFEMYPQYPYEISGFPANPGDVITATITYRAPNIFTMTIYNNTRRVYFAVPTSYTKLAGAARSSAEWIIEAPYSNQILPLSHFSTIQFSNCTAKINGVSGAINNAHWKFEAINMVTSTGALKDEVSALTNNGHNFSTVWKHE